MKEHEKYFFDVNGYLVVQKILSPELVAALNEAIDHNQDRVRLRERDQLLSANSPMLNYDELTPLQQAIMEPPYNPGRPNIAALLAEQEAA